MGPEVGREERENARERTKSSRPGNLEAKECSARRQHVNLGVKRLIKVQNVITGE